MSQCRLYIRSVCGGHLTLVHTPAATEAAPYSTTENGFLKMNVPSLLKIKVPSLLKQILANLYVG